MNGYKMICSIHFYLSHLATFLQWTMPEVSLYTRIMLQYMRVRKTEIAFTDHQGTSLVFTHMTLLHGHIGVTVILSLEQTLYKQTLPSLIK